MKRAWLVLGATVLLLAAVLAFLVHRLAYTEQGLVWLLGQVDRLQTVSIQVEGARGTLAGPLSAERVVIDHEAAHIELRSLQLVANPRALFVGLLRVERASVGSIDLRLKPRPPQPKQAPRFLPAWLRIEVPGFRVGPATVTLQNGTVLEASEATGSLALTRWRLDLDPLSVRGADGFIDGSLAVRATEPLGLRTNLRGEWRAPDAAYDYRFRVATRGNLGRLGAEVFLDAPARLSFSGTLLDLTEQPRAEGTFRFEEFDGSPWAPPERFPRLTGTIAVAAGQRGVGLDGTFTTPALPGQQLRLQGSGRFEERQVEITSLRAWLPRSGAEFEAAGTITLPAEDAPEGTLPALALSGEWSALRWPLEADAEAVVTSPHGVYTVEGAMPYVVSARAEVSGAALPTISFDAGGRVDRERLTLERFEGYALRGRIDGRGRLQWTGDQPWRFDVTARSLAIGDLRPGVSGTINATGNIAGNGLTAQAPWTAQLTSLSGTLFGRPVTGRGEIAHRDGSYLLRQVRLANGESHVDVNGRVGAAAMDLEWNVDLRSLALVARDMRGELVSQGAARGTPQRPQVRGTARLRGFQYAGISVIGAELDADVDASDERPSRIAFRSEFVETPAVRLDTVNATLDGRVGQHVLTVGFRSPGNPERRITEFRGAFRAEGGFDLAERSWAGDLVGADVLFPDGDARLIQPAALELGPTLQRAAPLCLRTDEDARFCVEGEHRATPRAWRVIYSAQDWPLKRLLRSVLGWQEFDGRLQASGWAQQEPGLEWIGGSTVLIHEPVFDVPRNKFRTERIRLGSSRFDLFVEPDALRASVELEVDEGTRVTGEARAERLAGDLLGSPLRGQITGTSEAIRVVPLLVPEIDRAAGTLRGEVKLAGTLREPQVDGEFQLRDGRIEMYRTNLVVTALQADGAFRGDELTFAAQGETARGKLTVDGNFSWPGGVMTGAMLLRGDRLLVADTPDLRVFASPDIVLRAGPDGYRVVGDVTIPSARISPGDIATSVDTSPDEHIVGIDDVGPQRPSSAERISSRIQVVLGDDVRVVAYGLRARLEGEVVVRSQPGDVVRGNGSIQVVEGQYKAFGQDIRITKGVLTYVNAPLSEPTIEIVAERVIKDADVTVAVNVRGTLEQPFINITSTPAMTNNEALSYLLTGRSIDTLQSGEAANINQTAENLALSGGGALLGGIGRRLGLDEVSVERTGEDDTSVVLGKALSSRLFVSYGISIAEAINTIKLRYTLNDRWSIKAEAGLEQSADVEFRIER